MAQIRRTDTSLQSLEEFTVLSSFTSSYEDSYYSSSSSSSSSIQELDDTGAMKFVAYSYCTLDVMMIPLKPRRKSTASSSSNRGRRSSQAEYKPKHSIITAAGKEKKAPESQENVWESATTIPDPSSFFQRLLNFLSGRVGEQPELKYFGSIKPIYEILCVEPKTYLANERTFLQWLNFSTLLGIGAVALLFSGRMIAGAVLFLASTNSDFSHFSNHSPRFWMFLCFLCPLYVSL